MGHAPLSSVRSIEHPDFAGVDIATTLDFATQPMGRNIRVAMDYLAPALIRRGHIIGLEQEIEYDVANASFTHITADERVTQNLGQERNTMFLDFMSDFMALAEGRKTTNPHIPRLDRVEDVCHVIAKAWEMREFTWTNKGKPNMILGHIGARKGSKGVVGKNFRPIAGKPLIDWSLDQLFRNKKVDAVVISTDDPEIYEHGLNTGCVRYWTTT